MEQKQFTREQLEAVIREELETAMKEGWLDRAVGRAKGAVSGGKQLGKNLGQAFTGNTSGVKDPRMIYQVTKGLSRFQTYSKNLNGLVQEMSTDLKKMFGQSYEKMPEVMKQHAKGLDSEMQSVVELIQTIVGEMQDMVANSGEQEQGNEEPSGDMFPAASDKSKQQQMKQYALRRTAQRGLRNPAMAEGQKQEGKK